MPPPDATKHSPAELLFLHYKDKFIAFMARYWLLFSRPQKYFDQYIYDQSAHELKRTIIHSFLTAVIVAAVLAIVFAYLPVPVESPYSHDIEFLTKPALLYFNTLAIQFPMFVINIVAFKLLKAEINYLIFLHVNSLTVGLLLLPFIMTSVIGLAFIAVFYFNTESHLQIFILFLISVPLSVILLVIFAQSCYMWVSLIERSTGRPPILCSFIFFTSTAVPTLVKLFYAPSLLMRMTVE